MTRISLKEILPSSSSSSTPNSSLAPSSGPTPTLSLYHCPKDSALFAKISPPRAPLSEIPHVPSSICLVIDVSGSMHSDAPVPSGPAHEEIRDMKLTVLDLVKHACNATIETLGPNDNLAIVSFSTKATVVQSMRPMTPDNKKNASQKIKEMRAEGSTNLWNGLKRGLELVKTAAGTEKGQGKSGAVMLLTDGMPNDSPALDYIPTLEHMRGRQDPEKMREMEPSIHTFGFGYHLESGLLKSLAEFGGGYYSFIPDSGMIASVFSYAVANLQSTFANHATLTLTYPSHLIVEETLGKTVVTINPELDTKDNSCTTLTIPLGSIKYGQDRDIPLKLPQDSSGASTTVTAALTYLVARTGGSADAERDIEALQPKTVSTVLDIDFFSSRDFFSSSCTSFPDIAVPLTPEEVNQHLARDRLCTFLSSLFPIQRGGKHKAIDRKCLPDSRQKLVELKEALATLSPAKTSMTMAAQATRGLIEDVDGEVTLALENSNWTRWGQHFLPSLLTAHSSQICIAFKDHGTQLYGDQDEEGLFQKSLMESNEHFNDHPLMKEVPTNENSQESSQESSQKKSQQKSQRITLAPAPIAVDMSVYNNKANGCFASSSRVRLEGGDEVGICKLRRDDRVVTPRGARKVKSVVKLPARQIPMVMLGNGVVVTAWHPVKFTDVDEDAGEYIFPAHVGRAGGARRVRYTGSIYTVLLEKDPDVEAHAICLAGRPGTADVWGVSLGHGLVKKAEGVVGGDVRSHAFFGSYEGIIREIKKIGGARKKDGVVTTGGVRRGKDGKVCGFLGPKKGGMRQLKALYWDIPVF